MNLLNLFAACLMGSLIPALAENLDTRYLSYGTLFVTNFQTAPFPHPDRAEGHKYHEEFFSAATNYSDGSVGIFVPKGFRETGKTDFIIHFHGWRNHIDTVLSQFNLVEQFCQSGRNAIFVVPQGPLDAADSFGGKLEDDHGFQRFINEMMQKLKERGIIHDSHVGDIILSGHSGGYHVMSGILARGGLQENIREVWLFDALYGGTENFTAWFAGTNAQRIIDIYTLHGGTREETEKLIESLKKNPAKTPFTAMKETDMKDSDLKNGRLIFIDSPLAHNEVIFKQNQFREYLKTSVLEPLAMDK
jgi:hypothetical protein